LPPATIFSPFAVAYRQRQFANTCASACSLALLRTAESIGVVHPLFALSRTLLQRSDDSLCRRANSCRTCREASVLIIRRLSGDFCPFNVLWPRCAVRGCRPRTIPLRRCSLDHSSCVHDFVIWRRPCGFSLCERGAVGLDAGTWLRLCHCGFGVVRVRIRHMRVTWPRRLNEATFVVDRLCGRWRGNRRRVHWRSVTSSAAASRLPFERGSFAVAFLQRGVPYTCSNLRGLAG
jgi:hypothetical protein